MNGLCKLCKVNQLENVGAHIFTESIVRTAFNEEGTTKRADKELIFEISSDKVDLDYFGSAVKPEKIEKITGQPITEEQIANNRNELISKDLVCRKCEKRFNPIETAFYQNIYSKIAKRANEALNANPCNFIPFENDKWLALQLVIINVWRASAARYDNWKLENEQEEYLRSFIDKTLVGDYNETIQRTIEYSSEIKDFDFALNYLAKDSEYSSDNGVLIDTSKNPYSFLLNLLSIVFDFKKLSENKIPDFLTSIIEQNLICIQSSQQEDELRIGIISNEQRKLLVYRILEYQVGQIAHKFYDNFIKLHQRVLGVPPNESCESYYHEQMKDYVSQRNCNIRIQEMKGLIEKIVLSCAKSSFKSCLLPFYLLLWSV